jgi:hypothetical protein
MTGYVAVTSQSALYNLSDTPYENDWLSGNWKATIYEKDKQFWNAIGTADHKTPVTVIGQELVKGSSGTYRYYGYLLVEQVSNGKQFYISVTDFVTTPYWESTDVDDVLSIGPCLAVYHQVSDYYPIDGNDKKATLADGETVLIRGRTTGGHGFGNSKTNWVDALTKSGRCYFNAADLTIIY